MKLNYYAIQKNINEWDPMGIICGYFDEYEREVDMIFDKCDYVKKNDIAGLAKVIAEVFDKQFNFDHWGNPMPSHSFNETVEDILPIARNIINACK